MELGSKGLTAGFLSSFLDHDDRGVAKVSAANAKEVKTSLFIPWFQQFPSRVPVVIPQ
jgi:hypothetical protein